MGNDRQEEERIDGKGKRGNVKGTIINQTGMSPQQLKTGDGKAGERSREDRYCPNRYQPSRCGVVSPDGVSCSPEGLITPTGGVAVRGRSNPVVVKGVPRAREQLHTASPPCPWPEPWIPPHQLSRLPRQHRPPLSLIVAETDAYRDHGQLVRVPL